MIVRVIFDWMHLNEDLKTMECFLSSLAVLHDKGGHMQGVQFLFFPIFLSLFLFSPIFKLKPPIFPIF